MTEPPSIGCPHCGQRYHMTPEQQAVYRGRTITCQQCAKPFTVDDRVPGGTIAMSTTGAAVPRPPASAPAGGPPLPGYVPPPPGYAPPDYAPPGGAPMPGYGMPPPGYGPYGPPPRRRSGIPVWVILLIIAVVGGPILISILLPALNRAREQANRIKCSSNMRQIGLALVMYASANKNQLPDTLDPLVAGGYVQDANMFVCPSSDHTAAGGTLTEGQNLSYVYVGKGMTSSGPTGNAVNTVVLYEPMGDHRNEGMNVLFLDGHVQWFGRQEAIPIVNDLQNGVNPPSTLP